LSSADLFSVFQRHLCSQDVLARPARVLVLGVPRASAALALGSDSHAVFDFRSAHCRLDLAWTTPIRVRSNSAARAGRVRRPWKK
jgi:hypothetical protein